MKKILIYSIDFDGCLDNAIQDKNNKYKNLLNNISQEIKYSLENTPKKSSRKLRRLQSTHQGVKENSSIIEIFIGSQRQSKAEEFRMIKGHSRPCANNYKKFKEDLQKELHSNKIKGVQVIFNPFLLGDLFNNLPHGTSFTQLEQLQKGCLETTSNVEVTGHFIDHSKLLLTYAQIHYIADKYKTEKISYGFYDDKKSEILDNLDYFFKSNPSWIPFNIELSLHRYAKKDLLPIQITTIKSEGLINSNYSNTIKDLAKNALRRSYDKQGQEQLNSIFISDNKPYYQI